MTAEAIRVILARRLRLRPLDLSPQCKESRMSGGARKLYLLRHSIVASHRGDVPLTDEGREMARQAGLRLGASEKQIRLLYGSTLRTRQTAESIAAGAVAAGASATAPRDAFALRNPDIYVAGERVNMVSSFAGGRGTSGGAVSRGGCQGPVLSRVHRLLGPDRLVAARGEPSGRERRGGGAANGEFRLQPRGRLVGRGHDSGGDPLADLAGLRNGASGNGSRRTGMARRASGRS